MARRVSVRNQFDRTVRSLQVGDADAGLVATGRMLADQLDVAAEAGDTKTLWLVQSLVGILRELEATPAARRAAKDAASAAAAQGGGRLASLRQAEADRDD